jgi:Thioesterase superfamily
MSGDWAEGGVQNPGRPWSGGGRDELAHQVRRLIAATVMANATPDALAAAADTLRWVADGLESSVPAPDTVPRGTFVKDGIQRDTAAGLAGAMPFDVVIGSCNPLALPMTIEFEPPYAIGHAVFTAPYEGAPGCVHGAALAGAFDIVLTAANVVGGAAGPTRTLSIRYLKPTLVGVESRFEAWVTSIEGREIRSTGRLLQGDVVTVEADGEFVNLDRPLIDSMDRRNRRTGAGDGVGAGNGASATDGDAAVGDAAVGNAAVGSPGTTDRGDEAPEGRTSGS